MRSLLEKTLLNTEKGVQGERWVQEEKELLRILKNMLKCGNHFTLSRFSSSSFFLACSASLSSAVLGFLAGGLLFFRMHELTYFSNSLRVAGFKVSKSISISSGFVPFSVGSRVWIIWTTLPSLSPADKQIKTEIRNDDDGEENGKHWKHDKLLKLGVWYSSEK